MPDAKAAIASVPASSDVVRIAMVPPLPAGGGLPPGMNADPMSVARTERSVVDRRDLGKAAGRDARAVISRFLQWNLQQFR